MIYFIPAVSGLRGFFYSDLACRYIFTDHPGQSLRAGIDVQIRHCDTSRLAEKIRVVTEEDLAMIEMLYPDKPHRSLRESWLRLKEREDQTIRGYNE